MDVAVEPANCGKFYRVVKGREAVTANLPGSLLEVFQQELSYLLIGQPVVSRRGHDVTNLDKSLITRHKGIEDLNGVVFRPRRKILKDRHRP